ncbi:MAG: Ig-like domain-containing protein [Ethanoligenens sp.]
MVNGLPIVSAAPAPSGAAPTAAQAAQTIPVTSVDFNCHSLTLSVGKTSQLTANVTPSNALDKALAWTSTNDAVATVDNSGNVKAVGAGTAYIRATNPDGQRDTCTVTVPGSSGNTGRAAANNGDNTAGTTGGNTGNAGGDSGSGTPAAQYVRVDTTRSYTDEITGIAQTVHFQGVGFANEVAGGYADINTTAALGAAHWGFNATVSLVGSNGIHQGGSTAVVPQDGKNASFTFSNLTAGTYVLQLTAHDGTVVAKYSFTVNSSGNVE